MRMLSASSLSSMRPAGEPFRQRRVDAVAGPGAFALRPEEVLFVVAQDDPRPPLLEQPHDLVREAVLVDAVAEADQVIDIAHQRERLAQPGGVAMNVGNDSQFHLTMSVVAPPPRIGFLAGIRVTLSLIGSFINLKVNLSAPSFGFVRGVGIGV